MDKEFINEDSTQGGYLNRGEYLIYSWKSKWMFKDNKLSCVFFEGDYDCKSVLLILEDKSHQCYRRCKLAYNRHKKEAEKHFGVLIEKIEKEPKTVKIIYQMYSDFDIKVDNFEVDNKGNPKLYKKIGLKHFRNTAWSEDKDKLIKEYNSKQKELKDLRSKIFPI